MTTKIERVPKAPTTRKLSQVLKPRYITSNDVAIPQAVNKQIGHHAIPIVQSNIQKLPHHVINEIHYRGTINSDSRPISRDRVELDGFYLLDASGISLPEDVQCIIVPDRNLHNVVDEDLTYFTELLYVDVSDNFLSLFPFGALPKLHELRIACNRIQNIDELFGFSQLMYLDMSYNQLQYTSISQLESLPLLKELDLSGNNLSAIPANMSGFQSLTKLTLQYNKFDNNNIFKTLGLIPNIRSLDLAHNFLSSFPKDCLEYDGFRFLETLDISFNFFASEEDVESIIALNRLVSVIIYGNPLLGPTGEDPMFVYIENMVDRAAEYRDAINSKIGYIEFVTEIPRKRMLKKGQPLGRMSLYRDFSIMQVDASISSQTNREWRKKGIQTLFGEAMASRKQLITSQAPALPRNGSGPLADYTFITNAISATNFPNHPSQQHAVNAYSSALNEADRDAIADDVMQRVVAEMGMTGEDDFKALEQMTRMPMSVMKKASLGHLNELMGMGSIHSGHDSFMLKKGSITSKDIMPPLEQEQGGDELIMQGSIMDDGELLSAQLPKDHLPRNFFGASNMVSKAPAGPSLATQPIAIKTAMKALQRAVEQPLTNYDEVPARHGEGNNKINRSTASSRTRQLPRIPLSANIFELDDDAQDRASNTFKQRGLAEPPQLKQARKENRERTLEQIEQVLQNLNESTLLFTAGDAENKDSSQGVSAVKQAMNRMKYFAKPNPAVANLSHMVQNIVDEFAND